MVGHRLDAKRPKLNLALQFPLPPWPTNVFAFRLSGTMGTEILRYTGGLVRQVSSIDWIGGL